MEGGPRTGRAGASSVRRPLRGLEVKEDTFAMIKVIDLVGREIRLIDSGATTGKSPTYTNFILQSVVEPRQEKFQLVETFGAPYAFFYGEQARFLECTCTLINSQDFNWQAEFWENYDMYLRGSKCAEIGARVYLFYDDKIVEGYMLQATAVNDAMNPMAVGLNFRMFLTNYRNISLVGDPKFPIRLGVDVSLQTQPTSSTTQTTTSQAQKLTAAGASTLSTVPLRGLIHDNADEWTGPQPEEPPEEDPQEVEDLIAAAVEEAAKNASNMNSVDSIMDSGLGDAGEGTGGPTPDVGPSGASCAAYGTCQDNPYGGVGQMVCRGTDGVVRPVCPDYFDKVQEAADKQGQGMYPPASGTPTPKGNEGDQNPFKNKDKTGANGTTDTSDWYDPSTWENPFSS